MKGGPVATGPPLSEQLPVRSARHAADRTELPQTTQELA